MPKLKSGDADRLRAVAEWVDKMEGKNGYDGHQARSDLIRIADAIEEGLVPLEILLTRPSETCRKTGVQNCQFCDDLYCGDNTSQAKKDMQARVDTISTLANALAEANKERPATEFEFGTDDKLLDTAIVQTADRSQVDAICATRGERKTVKVWMSIEGVPVDFRRFVHCMWKERQRLVKEAVREEMENICRPLRDRLDGINDALVAAEEHAVAVIGDAVCRSEEGGEDGVKTLVYDPDHGHAVSDATARSWAYKLLEHDVAVSTENVIQAARLLIHQGELDHDKIRFVFQGKVLSPDKNGRLEEWIEGFCDYSEKILQELINDGSEKE